MQMQAALTKETVPRRFSDYRPLSQAVCLECSHPFPTVSLSAKFCSDRCRLRHWKKARRRKALVDLLLEFFEIKASQRPLLRMAVERFEQTFLHFASWLGFCYRSKRHVWTQIA